MRPQELQQAVHAAALAFEAGRAAEAVTRAETILAAAPGEPTACQILAMVRLGEGRADDAIAYLHLAAKTAPHHPPLLNMLGVALKQTGDRPGARKAFVKSRDADGRYAEPRVNLANLDLEDDRRAAAKTGFEAVLKLQPSQPNALSGLARIALLENDAEAAASHAEAVLKVQPGHVLSILTLTEALLRLKDYKRVISVARRLEAVRGASPTNRALALGCVAEAHDKLGHYDEAFAGYTCANRMLAEINQEIMLGAPTPYNPLIVARMTEYMESQKGQDEIPAMADDEPAPAFLVGFPRSGTTLLEQVLLAHPKVMSIEEQETLADAYEELILAEDGFARLAALTEEEAAGYRKQYWARASALGARPGAGEVLVDKMPLNTALLPLIAKIFPRAKIIFALRDPRDVVLSCFQQRFGLNQAMYQFLDMTSAARYYDRVMTLGTAARQAFGFDLKDVRYEEIVADLESVARSVLEFLELEWDAAVLSYREGAKARSINTPSVGQVVEPIYTSALGKWRNYETHMAPVRDVLDPWAKGFGYD